MMQIEKKINQSEDDNKFKFHKWTQSTYNLVL